MELLKLEQSPASFQWHDVTIFYRTVMATEDRYAIDISGQVMKGGVIEYKPWELYKTFIRLFVTGWKGVTEDGKEIPYTYETLMKRLPSEKSFDKPGDTLVMQLGYKIGVDIGYLEGEKTKEVADLKND